MWLFIVLTQLLAFMTSAILWWLIKPKRRISKIGLVSIVFIVNNIALIYGLTEFWRERFHIYLVIGILQGFMFYAALLTAAITLFYRQVLKQKSRPKLTRALAIVSYIGIVSVAVFNAYVPVVHRITVTTAKPLAKSMTMALVSDTHIGRWFGSRQLNKLAALIDTENVDVVVLAGDIMNDSTFYYYKNNMAEQLSKLKAPLGVYAVLGNHDYSGQQVDIAKAVAGAGIKIIDNKNVWLGESVVLVGRSDETDPMRPAAADLLAEVDTDKPIVFLEHSLANPNEMSTLPIDLHLSGHTHGGQIFPLTILMKWFKPLLYGAEQIGNTKFLVTSGYGFGAVPFRLATRSEIWVIMLESVAQAVD